METRKQVRTTFNEKELQFIRDNVGKMKQKEMAKILGCSQGKVFQNSRIAGIKFPVNILTNYRIVDDCVFNTCPITGFKHY